MVGSRRHFRANVRYLRALLRRFRTTLVLAVALFVVGPLMFHWRYRGTDGDPISFGEALHHVYFLLYGQPSLPYVHDWLIELLNVVIPPVGIALVADGVVRFAYLFFARHKNDKEWIEVVTETMKGHVVVCGAGRVGYRVVTQLREMDKDVVVVEKREDAAFVSALRDENVPLLIDDTRSPLCLPRTNVKNASAIVCATDDDLANLNIALDARKLNPKIRVVIRLFDEDLSGKVRDTFKAEALSSSSLAAPAMALAALDPRIVHSFHLGKHLMVVSLFEAREGLPGVNISAIRDRFGGLALSLLRDGHEQLHPIGDEVIRVGDVLTVQASYPEYCRLRAFANEAEPPIWSHQDPLTPVWPRKVG
ncbi:potassium channel family protein [Myxococcus qinghaiensis]|uniref:potassium channel family protein n=1 Tax=Myxococcus qinghaiensis TaxID=2906758 RepID=UPI0020A80954|nr:potassium channel protein [Myxococcus qinghaiensis]MCP3164615.1 NAD-binding protein [Myxococcus qinghaiensis]